MEKHSNALEAILRSEMPKKEVPMPRLGSSFTIRAFSYGTFKDIQSQHKENDSLALALINQACESPKWSDEDILSHYGVEDGCSAIGKALLPDEVPMLLTEVLALLGFGDEKREGE